PSLLFSSRLFAPSQLSSLSLHDALPISPTFFVLGCPSSLFPLSSHPSAFPSAPQLPLWPLTKLCIAPSCHFFHASALMAIFMTRDRKSTRLNSSHVSISYAVFCLKKKKQ